MMQAAHDSVRQARRSRLTTRPKDGSPTHAYPPKGLLSGIAMGEQGDKAKDILGRVYEYFLLH